MAEFAPEPFVAMQLMTPNQENIARARLPLSAETDEALRRARLAMRFLICQPDEDAEKMVVARAIADEHAEIVLGAARNTVAADTLEKWGKKLEDSGSTGEASELLAEAKRLRALG